MLTRGIQTYSNLSRLIHAIHNYPHPVYIASADPSDMLAQSMAVVE
jgi:hypothetical protein